MAVEMSNGVTFADHVFGKCSPLAAQRFPAALRRLLSNHDMKEE